jgi:hypothetical protein
MMAATAPGRKPFGELSNSEAPPGGGSVVKASARKAPPASGRLGGGAKRVKLEASQ